MKVKTILVGLAIFAVLAAAVIAASTDKKAYSISENIIIYLENQTSVQIISPSASYRILDSTSNMTLFTPRETGIHYVIVQDNDGNILRNDSLIVVEFLNEPNISVTPSIIFVSEIVSIEVEIVDFDGIELQIKSPKDSYFFVDFKGSIKYVPEIPGTYEVLVYRKGHVVGRKDFFVNAKNLIQTSKAVRLNETKNNILNSSPEIIARKNDFGINEPVVFELNLPIEQAPRITGFATLASNPKLNISLIGPDGRNNDEIALIPIAEGKYNVRVAPKREFKPGKYRLEVIGQSNGQEFMIQNDFTWGVLAINVNKSIYGVDENAFISMAVLDDGGHIVCDADVTLEFTSPNGRIQTFSTNDFGIIVSDECEYLGVTSLPDYYATYRVQEAGIYLMNLTAKTINGVRSITDSFLAKQNPIFDVARQGPTRIYPAAKYRVGITIGANQFYRGQIHEYVPLGFNITEKDGLRVRQLEDSQQLTWNAYMDAGATVSLSYEFDAPDKSPEFYLLGELEIGKWSEARQWQIASDAVPQGMILFWNESAIPEGWTCISCQPADPFYLRFPNGSASYGATSGASTHSPGSSGVAGTTTSFVKALGGNAEASDVHTHTVSYTVGQSTNLPIYTNLSVIRYNGGTPYYVPSGAIAIFNSSPPAGWSVMENMNGRFARGSPSDTANTQGGANSHNHAVQSGLLSGASGAVRDQPSGANAAPISHTHTFSGTSDSQEHAPPFASVVFAKLTADDMLIPEGMIAMFNDTPASANWDVVSGTTGNNFLNSRLINGTTSYSIDGTGGGKTHTHGQSVIESGANSGTPVVTRDGTGGAADGHTHTVTITYQEIEHTPSFINVIFASKKRDITAPLTSIIYPIGGNYSANLFVNASVNDTESIVNDVNLSLLQPGTLIARVPLSSPVGGVHRYFSATFDTSAYPDGFYNLSVNATDASGNTNISANVSILIDNTPVNFTIVEPFNNSNLSSNIFQISVGLNDSISGLHTAYAIMRSASGNSGSLQQLSLTGGNIHAGIWTVSYTAPTEDDVYNISLSANDTAGTLITFNISQFVFDQTPPNASTIAPVSSSNHSSNILINASVNDSLSKVFNVSYRAMGPLTSAWVYSELNTGSITSGYWNGTLTLGALSDGLYNITANATDFAGNQLIKNISQITIDRTIPNISQVYPLNVSNNTQTFLTNYSANDSLSGTINLTIRVINQLQSSAWHPSQKTTGTIYVSYWSRNFEPSGLLEGQYNITVNATDFAGNQVIANLSEIMVDRTKPNITVQSPLNGTLHTSSAPYEILTNDSLSAVFNVSIRAVTPTQITSWATGTLSAGTIYEGRWDSTIDFSALADGKANITVNATDFAGNQNIVNLSEIIIDNTAPNNSIITPSQNANISGIFLINTSVNETTGTVISVNATIYNNTGNASIPFSMSIGAGSNVAGYWNTTIDSSMFRDGNYNVSTNATDMLGQINISQNVSIVIDNTHANTTIIEPINGSSVIGIILLNASVNDSLTGMRTVEYRLISQLAETLWIDAGKNSGTIYTGYWSADFNTPELDDDTYNITVRATDFAGTQFMANISEIDIINGADITAPNISIDIPKQYSNISGIVRVRASANDTGVIIAVNLSLYNNTGNATGWILMSLGSGTTGIGLWNATISTLALNLFDGKYNLSINASDDEGNVNVSRNVSVTIDNTKPNASRLIPHNGTIFSRTSFSVNISANDTLTSVFNVSIRLQKPGAQFAWKETKLNFGDRFAGYWNGTLNSQNYPDGIYNITVNATDYAMSQTIANLSQIIIDNDAPNTSIILPRQFANISGNLFVNVSSNDTIGSVAKVNLTIFNNTHNATSFIPLSLGVGTLSIGYWNMTYSTLGLSDGRYNLSINATDLQGNTNITLNTSITIDNTKTNMSVANPLNLTNISANLLINVSANDSLSQVQNASARLISSDYTSAWNYLQIGIGNIQNGYWNITIAVSAVADGKYNVTVNTTDFAGNQNLANLSNVRIDKTNANVSLISPVNASVHAQRVLINASLNDSVSGIYNASYRFTNNNGDVTTQWLGLKLYSGDIYSGYWNETASTISLPDGTYNITINVTDFAGNQYLSNASNFKSNNNVPNVSILLPIAKSNSSGIILINTSVNESIGTVVSVNYTLSLNTGNAIPLQLMSLGAGTTNIGYWNATFNTASIADGRYNISLQANDSSGNLARQNLTIVIDNTKPNATIRTPANLSTNFGVILVNASVNDSGSGIFNTTYRLISPRYNSGWIYAQLNSGSVYSGFWNMSFDSNAYTDGLYNITINATDFAGNNVYSNISEFVIDNKAPNVSINLPLNNSNKSSIITIAAAINDSGSGVKLANATIFNNTANVTRVELLLTSGNSYIGVWSTTYDTTQIPDGYYNITVNATDNIARAQSTANYSFVVDNTKSNITAMQPINGTTKSEGMLINASVNDSLSGALNVTYRLHNFDSTAISAWAQANQSTGDIKAGYWSVIFGTRAVPNGDYNVTARVTDYAGTQTLVNISEITVFNLKRAAGENEATILMAQSCNTNGGATQSLFANACGNSYPNTCPLDAVSCNDANTESVVINTGDYGGVNISSYNSSIVNCATIQSARLCYEWYISDSRSYDTCEIAVDNNGDLSWTTTSITCPSTTTNIQTCVDITSQEGGWVCDDFFDRTTPGAWAYVQGHRTGGGGGHTLSFDSLYFNVTYTEGKADLDITDNDIIFLNTTPYEDQNITVNATITNLGEIDAGYFTVEFFNGLPIEENPISNTTVLGLANGSSIIVNSTFLAHIGPNYIYVRVDLNNSVNESNENNNIANNTVNVVGYTSYIGNFTQTLALSGSNNWTLRKWDETNTTGNVYIADADSSIDFTQLKALGRNFNDIQTSDDFLDADILLKMTNFTDSIRTIFTIDGNNPIKKDNFTVFGIEAYNVSVANSTNSSLFETGILWDMSDDASSNGEYDATDSEDLVFVSKAGAVQNGRYGNYNSEIRVPSNLRSYIVPDDNTNVVFYREII